MARKKEAPNRRHSARQPAPAQAADRTSSADSPIAPDTNEIKVQMTTLTLRSIFPVEWRSEFLPGLMRAVFAPSRREAARQITALRKWARDHPELAAQHGVPFVPRSGGRPRGNRTFDPTDATLLAVVAKYGGLKRTEMLDAIGIRRGAVLLPAALNRLNPRIQYGLGLFEREGASAAIPEGLRPERLLALSPDERRHRCREALRHVKPF